jgi:tRNA (Thr-GGU) A37 N-methylase
MFVNSFTASSQPNRHHPVHVFAVERTRLQIGPIEVIDGTPVLDVKAQSRRDESAWVTSFERSCDLRTTRYCEKPVTTDRN